MAVIALDIIFIVVFSSLLWWLYSLFRALSSDAPYVPMRTEVVARLVEMVDPRPNSVWIDLGSGDGRVLIAAVKRHGVQGIGIERVLLLRLISRVRVLLFGMTGRVRIRRGNLFFTDLTNADTVSFYLLPESSRKLFEMFRTRLKPGTTVVYHRYRAENIPIVKEDIENQLYVSIV